MLNVIVTVSNLIGIIGVNNYYQKKLYFQAIGILSSILCSCGYHIVENIKHNMPGIGYLTDKTSQHLLLNCDRTTAVLAAIVTLRQIITKQINPIPLLPLLITGIAGLVIPELVSGLYSLSDHESIIPNLLLLALNPNKYHISVALEHIIYVIGHCVWHGCMFQISNIVSTY